MSIKKLKKDVFNDLVAALIDSDQRVVGVKAKGDRFAFGDLESADELRLDYDVTLLPPKKFMLPQMETLLKYEVGGEYKSAGEAPKMTLIGVHPYDLVAINQMDEIFAQDEYDKYYMNRRNNITIIACDVVTPSKNVFAGSMGTATVDKGYDVLLTDMGDSYLAEAATDKGEELLAKAAQADDASPQDIEARSKVWQENKEKLNKHKLNCEPGDIPKLLDKEEVYDHPVWEEKASMCYSCGSCTSVCPTCYCFDVQDDVEWNLKEGKRWRAWDGCVLENFATVTGEHNFRKQRAQRFRHRIFRKGKYVPSKIGGQIACVGCGRCVTACTTDIANPVDIYNRLLEDVKI
ncbi:Anaerobic sulfite reductase iron-sulfur subunit [Anaerohalosphaera lusitana]|uniref:Anaerobic sulfite reductase iron-sulfur subunit n=1 Tax=Anaerohalosphaera lusitana TaxID=1936003 RepID=A0A1U9NKG7_9BACT|nr:4Fe-4S dicluster domain-containing protein [Anaerohalosphaera lusitana]AQT68297.1 Anaerobic sulfite reductase iron-sulfur subunit [Anaerohalosphaera lusitana]